MIPVNTPDLSGNEAAYLIECIQTGWISSEGPFVKRFERNMASTVDRTHGIAVSNGSVALEVALRALGVGPGDEVILPTFTIISCAAAVVRAGARPVVVDADPNSWNMTAQDVAEAITKNTRAIMLVHIYGLPVDCDPILKLAADLGIPVLEDAAEMLGQTYRGRPCGSLGQVSTFSFYPNKHVTAGEGGMVLTDDERIASRSRSLRDLCFHPSRRFVHDDLGWNFRLSNLQAAVGVAQLERLQATVERKRQIGARYHANLSRVKALQLPIPETDYARNIYWVFGIVLHDDLDFDAHILMERLAAHGIGSRPFFWPMHQQPVFREMGLFEGVSLPHSERLARRGFYLPSGLALKDHEIDQVSEVLEALVS